MSPTVSPQKCSTSSVVEGVGEGQNAKGEVDEATTKEATDLIVDGHVMPIDGNLLKPSQRKCCPLLHLPQDKRCWSTTSLTLLIGVGAHAARRAKRRV